MNFLRQKADELFQSQQQQSAQAAAEESRDDDDEPVQDPEMDAAIAAMKERLENLRAQTMLQQTRNEREVLQLEQKRHKLQQQLTTSLETFVKGVHLTPYLAATKQTTQEHLPGVVATLQAQLCLHVHGICMHNEQIQRAKQDASDVCYWYEDMVKQLRQDQADQELQLMNELVQAKITMGELVDAKKLRERHETCNPCTTRNGGLKNRRFSRTISSTTTSTTRSSSSLRSIRSSRSSTRSISSSSFSRRGSMMRSQGSVRSMRNLPEVKIERNVSRQRIVRNISRRGTATSSTMMMKKQNSTNLLLQHQEGSWRSLDVSPIATTTSKLRRVESTSLPSELRVSPLSSSGIGNAFHQSSQTILEEMEEEEEKDKGCETEDCKTPGLQAPSSDIAERRAARAKARAAGRSGSSDSNDRGRPARRAMQRTRSKSLTTSSKKEESKGQLRGRKRTSKDDSVVKSQRQPSTHQQLLLGFPAAKEEKKKKERRDTLLRGFSPAPPPVVLSSPPPEPIDRTTQQENIGGGFMAFRNWMGTMMQQQTTAPAKVQRKKSVVWVG